MLAPEGMGFIGLLSCRVTGTSKMKYPNFGVKFHSIFIISKMQDFRYQAAPSALTCMLYVEHIETRLPIFSGKFTTILGPPKWPPEIFCERFANILFVATLVPKNRSTF